MMPESINVEQYVPAIRKLARAVKVRYRLRLSEDELCSAAYQALLDVIDAGSYEPSRGEFWPYVYKILRGSMIDEVEKLGRPRQQHALYKIARDAAEASRAADVEDQRDKFYETIAQARSTVFAFGAWAEAEDLEKQSLEKTPEAVFAVNEQVQQLLERIELLPEHHRTMIRRRCLEELPLKTVAEQFGITEPRASQMVAQAKAILREDMSDAPPSRKVPNPPRTQLHIRPPIE